MKKGLFLFGLIVLTIITVSCKLDLSQLDNMLSVTLKEYDSQEPEPAEPTVRDLSLPGVFTVNSDGKQVKFSLGALYWDCTEFRMEESQYDYRTWYNAPSVINGEYKENNTDIAEGQTGLFYWSKDVEKTYSCNYDSTGRTSDDIFALADGGVMEGWDILSEEEWRYLLQKTDKSGLATITTGQSASVRGLVLLPDSWVMPEGCNWTAGTNSGWTTNEYDATQWESMEQAGAVFLPTMGCRNRSEILNVNSYAYWCSSTTTGFDVSCNLSFGSEDIGLYPIDRSYGQGVRLVVTVSEGVSHEHTHTYSSEWTTDETYHWHAATCEHTDEVSDKAEHDFENGTCSVCGYVQPNTESGPKPDKLSGVFNVNSSGKQVQFSKGALYWDGSTFRMEDNQYDFRTWNGSKSVIGGVETTEITDGQTGLFYWSKDMEKTYAKDYDSTGKTSSDIFALANGGAIEGWGVLNKEEWVYLFTEREDASSKYGHTTISTEQGTSVHGLVLLPDSWILPDGCSWTAGCENEWTTNSYNAAQWVKMEQAGAVFFPAAGYRYGSTGLGDDGYWWASTPDSNSSGRAHYLNFYSGHVDVYMDSINRSYGSGVRLVAPVNAVPHIHTYSSEWTTDETYHWHEATCEHTDEVSDKAEHSFGEWSVTTEATCTANGEKERICTVCGYKETETVSATGHSFSTEWTTDETHHWHEATCGHTDEVSDYGEHSFENGCCSVCGCEDMEPIPGYFTVSEGGKQVQFLRGCLYWDGSSFRMERNQYDFRTWNGSNSVIGGVETTEIPAGQTGLLYWSKSAEKTYTLEYEDSEAGVDDKFVFADGGVIEDGDVLTTDEWTYLISRKDADDNVLSGLATIQTAGGANVAGLVLLPDSWVLPHGITFTPSDNYADNIYQADQWKKMEKFGAVFLPAASYRDGFTADGAVVDDEIGSVGYVWASSPDANDSNDADIFSYDSTSVEMWGFSRKYGSLVRLVTTITEGHVHTYSSAWSTDDTYHWHEATCEHTDEVSDKTEHDFENGTCSVCGYVQPGPKPEVLSGVFTVNSDGKQVQFSKGALYWDGSSFRIEENQYDFRTWYNAPSVINGEYKTNNTDTPEGVTGLFYWSKDVEKTYALNYDSTGSTTSETFGLGNGGAIRGLTVLDANEWQYLITRDNTSKYGLATITTEQGASVHGLVLLPDSWTLPDGCNWTAGLGKGWVTNEYNATQWEEMEQAGAVFLPAEGGMREGSTVKNVGDYGFWWTNSPGTKVTYAHYLYFYTSGPGNVGTSYRRCGHGVRLVAPVEN